MDEDLHDVPLQLQAPPGMGLPAQPNNDLNDNADSSQIAAVAGMPEQLEQVLNRIGQLE